MGCGSLEGLELGVRKWYREQERVSAVEGGLRLRLLVVG